MISYELTVTNTGLLEIFNISVGAWGDGAGIAGPFTCNDVDGSEEVAEADTDGGLFPLTPRGLTVRGLASYPNSGLRGGSSLICAFSSAVGQSEVRNQADVKYIEKILLENEKLSDYCATPSRGYEFQRWQSGGQYSKPWFSRLWHNCIFPS